MKKIYLLYFIFYLTPIFSQVGIETTNPTASLDINGDLRVRNSSATINETAAKDSILVTNNLGNVMRISSQKVIQSYFKTCIKGSFTSSSDVSLTLSSGAKKIPFDYIEFDSNNEFNTSNSTFTATQGGIYSIDIHIKSTSAIGVALDFGVAIVKNGTVITRDSFANIGILSINATPPVRSSRTIISLAPGDTITFSVLSSLGSLNILGNKEDCYFTIHQVR
jgi:BclA C-terminal domain